MGDRARAKWAEKHGGGLLCPFPRGEPGPHLTQCRLGRVLLPYQVASWSIQPFGHNTPTMSQTDRQTTVRFDRANRFTTGRPETIRGWTITHTTSSRKKRAANLGSNTQVYTQRQFRRHVHVQYIYTAVAGRHSLHSIHQQFNSSLNRWIATPALFA